MTALTHNKNKLVLNIQASLASKDLNLDVNLVFQITFFVG